MKISTKGRYGLEALVDLAIHSSQNCVSIKSISGRCGISEAYILQIFLALRRAGIIESIRGAQGGYILAKEPSKITVGSVLTVLEGPLAPVVCLDNRKDSSCEWTGKCAARGFWEEIMRIVEEVAVSITVEDLVKCYNQYPVHDSDLEYYI